MLSLLVAIGLSGADPRPIPRTHCEMPWQETLDVWPRGPGPLRATGLHCHRAGVSSQGEFDPIVSPDGQRTAVLFRGDPEGMLRLFETAGAAEPASYDTGIGVLMAFTGVRSAPIVAWSADSRFVWTARQTRIRPVGGHALTPLQPVRVYPDGRAEDLPALRHPAGSLDGLLWAGHRGLALAQFGSRGGMYRPAHDDPTPTFAIVDAGRGRVLESMTFSRLWALTGLEGREPTIYAFAHISAVALPDGRVRILFVAGERWILWTQGESPRRVAAGAAPARGYDMVFDGRHVLVMRPSPRDERVVVTSCGGGRHGPCPPRDPRRGDWAALYDVETGERLWRMQRTFDVRDRYGAPPAISPDGRYALIGLEPDPADSARDAALVSLRDGRIVQTIPASPSHYTLGFSRNGRAVWLNAQSYTAVYRLD